MVPKVGDILTQVGGYSGVVIMGTETEIENKL